MDRKGDSVTPLTSKPRLRDSLEYTSRQQLTKGVDLDGEKMISFTRRTDLQERCNCPRNLVAGPGRFQMHNQWHPDMFSTKWRMRVLPPTVVKPPNANPHMSSPANSIWMSFALYIRYVSQLLSALTHKKVTLIAPASHTRPTCNVRR